MSPTVDGRFGGAAPRVPARVWTHAQLIHLAWSLDAGRPVEQPGIVDCRCARAC